MSELKNKQLPTFGTNQERKDRLKKFHGIEPSAREYSYDIGYGQDNQIMNIK